MAVSAMAESIITELKNVIDAYALQAPDKLEEKQNSLWKHTKKVTEDSKKAVKKKAWQVGRRMARPVLNWIFIEPIVLHPREHPEWPGYTGIGNKLKFRLGTQVYESRCLVENTIACFYPTKDHLNLTPTQLVARGKIIQLFEKLRDKSFGPLELNEFMRLFDAFFFFGAMTNKCRPRIFLHVWLKKDRFAKSYVSPFFETIMPWGFTRDRHVRGYGPISEIHLAGSTFYIDPAPLWFFVQTLIHEMVHAYVHLYLCQCPTCCRNSNNTCGPSGHGQTFLMLIDCIDQTMRSWGVGLSGLMNEMVSYMCAAGAACPQAAEHDEKGFRWFRCDELMNLYEKEKHIVELRSLPRDNEPSSQPDEKRTVEITNEAKDKKKQESQGQDWTDVNEAEKKQEKLEQQDSTDVNGSEDNDQEKPEQGRTANEMKPVEEREPGTQVYMTAARAGATKVEQAMLDRTSDIVQALIAKKPAKSSEKSSLTQLNLPFEAQRQMDKNIWVAVDLSPKDCQYFTSQPRLPWPTNGDLPWPRTSDQDNQGASSPALIATTTQKTED
ncbi:hypothetical protein F4680DRAFT_471566 [Xylaria scruposa]|nr:hypothetical protein F4680DRAFT_471566 [Xylaria scruposa]